MKVELKVEINCKEDNSDYLLIKKLEMDSIPDVGEEIGEEQNEDDAEAIFFTVEKRTFYLRGYVDIDLEPKCLNNKDLKRLKEFGWTY